jgi:hypothetical protein
LIAVPILIAVAGLLFYRSERIGPALACAFALIGPFGFISLIIAAIVAIYFWHRGDSEYVLPTLGGWLIGLLLYIAVTIVLGTTLFNSIYY